ncbi:MAG: hypothetical protein WDN23_18255 [Edaphobacter sp.]
MLGGLGLFIVGVVIARIATKHDVEILRVLFNSGKFRRRYDPMKADATEIRIARRDGRHLFDNSQDTLAFARFQTFNFDGWSDYPDVLEPLLFYVLQRASSEIEKPQNIATFKMFVIDEAWIFLKNRTIREWITRAEKTWRKKNAAMLLATQSVVELAASDIHSNLNLITDKGTVYSFTLDDVETGDPDLKVVIEPSDPSSLAAANGVRQLVPASEVEAARAQVQAATTRAAAAVEQFRSEYPTQALKFDYSFHDEKPFDVSASHQHSPQSPWPIFRSSFWR